ncbi:predicted protein [Naegleria gruberi]|uniref:Predicted protein n=1 Tax=Naegleria gruberi TaxID=5762 RepID=D2VQR2_NAEGR|nr:uncharacterized protein NAEGRDRAFT_71316 [Naegleria gruberi]EFC40689.1 predicted protein [Naegleria gruberi]|eukprot:XP_002673433.1 predicted protein [Naegleria gruberi strain NEG-M]
MYEKKRKQTLVEKYPLVFTASSLNMIYYVITALRVGRARSKYGVFAPAVSGHPEFEKALRIQMNGLEYLPVVITSMWSTALITQNDVLAGGMGLTYLSGRILYGITYPDKRRAGFLTLFFSMLGLLGITTFYSVDGLVKKYSNKLK